MPEKLPKVICGRPDHPLKIGEIEIPCYVLSDGTRILHQRGMVSALGMGRGGSSKGGGDRLAHFVKGKIISAYISDKTMEVTTAPLKFITPKGNIGYGYNALVLADICESVLDAKKRESYKNNKSI